MSDQLEREVLSRLRKAFNEYKAGHITKKELQSKLFDEAAVLEQDRWRIIEDLRARAPESERELATQVADLNRAAAAAMQARQFFNAAAAEIVGAG